MYARKALQLNGTQRLLLVGRRYVELHYLVGFHLSRILDIEDYLYLVSGGRYFLVDLKVAVFESCIGETVTEGPCNAGIRLV